MRCECDASTRARRLLAARTRGDGVDDAERWTGGTRRCITRIPRPPGHRYLGCGFTRRKHTYFSRRGAIGTPFRGGKYIFFNFLYGVDIILIVKYYFMVFVKAVGAGRIYRRIFKRITLKTDRI